MTDQTYRFGDFELDPGRFKLLRRGAVLPLEPKALDLLLALIERAPRVVDKTELFTVVWKEVAVTDNALTRLVAQLRKALDDHPKAAARWKSTCRVWHRDRNPRR